MLEVGGEEEDGAGERESGEGQAPARSGHRLGRLPPPGGQEAGDDVAESSSEERNPRQQRELVPARGRAVGVLEERRQPRDVEVPTVTEEEVLRPQEPRGPR